MCSAMVVKRLTPSLDEHLKEITDLNLTKHLLEVCDSHFINLDIQC